MAIEFKVVNTPRHDRFEDQITALLNGGRSLHGSPFISQTGGMTQALIKQSNSSKNIKKDKVNETKKV